MPAYVAPLLFNLSLNFGGRIFSDMIKRLWADKEKRHRSWGKRRGLEAAEYIKELRERMASIGYEAVTDRGDHVSWRTGGF